MQLNHLSLSVPDVGITRRFLEEYFEFHCEIEGEHEVLMRDSTGLVLNVNNQPGLTTEPDYPGRFHVGFMVKDRESVDAMNRRLKEGGFDVEPPQEAHNSWSFYVRAPGGFVVEILHSPAAEEMRRALKSGMTSAKS